MNISVIIPVYNVEKYVERCILSIMNQTYTESVECIVVDDCTPDNSMKIVEKMVSDYKGQIQFKLLYHEHNRGLAAVRNTGLAAATGDYIIHIDSDDYCELDMLEKMYAKAIEENADIVVADYWTSGEDSEIYSANIVPDNKMERIKSILQNRLPAYLWRQLMRRSLFEDNLIRSNDGIDFREDVILVCKLYYYAPKVVHLPKAFVHYVQYNTTSYTKVQGRKSLNDLIEGESAILSFFEEKNMGSKLNHELLGMRISDMQLLLFRSKGKLQKQWLARYADITTMKVIKHSVFGKGVGRYWKLAFFFASLRMLWMHNLMRAVWTVLRKKQAQRIIFFSE